MADWQERVQSAIIGFVFAYMVMKLFSVISSFRAGNLRVTRASDDEVPLLVPSEIVELAPADEQSVPLVGTDEETEADGGDEQDDRAHGASSSSSSDSEAEDEAAPASRPREIDSADEPALAEVESKDEEVENNKGEKVHESKKDEEVEDVEQSEPKDVISSSEHSLKALNEETSGDVKKDSESSGNETDDWEVLQHADYQKSKEPAKEAGEGKDDELSQSSDEMDALPVLSDQVTSGEGNQAETSEPIHECARKGDLECLGQLLDFGASIDQKDGDGRTLLILAAHCGQLDAVKLLIAKGAEIHAKDLEGQTALHYAAIHEQEMVAKYLVEYGADMNSTNNDGTTPLKLCPPHWLWLQSSAT